MGKTSEYGIRIFGRVRDERPATLSESAFETGASKDGGFPRFLLVHVEAFSQERIQRDRGGGDNNVAGLLH